jgi:hypothetical protein
MRSVKVALAGAVAASLALTLGPALGAGSWSARVATYMGGSDLDGAVAVATDSSGARYVVGTTSSADFPIKNGLYGSSGGQDAFVAKIAADGRTVLWATCLGGSGDDQARAVAVDGSGDVWVVGSTTSNDFPLSGAMQGGMAGGVEGFVTVLSTSGALLASTYIGGTGDDQVRALAIDAAGNAWIAGESDSDDLPVTFDAAQYYRYGDTDAFAVQISSDATTVVYATYVGGYGPETCSAVVVDAFGSATLAGRTSSEDFPLVAPIQGALAGGTDAFLARIDATSRQLSLGTYYGGSDDDAAHGLALDADGILLAAGSTRSGDLPVNAALQSSSGGGLDAFVLSLSADGSAVRFATYLGGSGDDEALAAAYDAAGVPVVAGAAGSSDFPLRAAAQPDSGGGVDAFVARLSKSGATLEYASYLGGSGDDSVAALLIDSDGMAVAAGATGSADLPLVTPFQAAAGGNGDALFARLLLAPPAPTNVALGGLSHLQVTLTWSDPTDGLATFEIQRSETPGVWEGVATLPAGTTSWTDTDVLPQTVYHYRVRAYIDGVASDFTADIVAGTLAIPNPAAPGAPTLEVLSPTSISVQWTDNSHDEVKFEVFRAVDGGSFSVVKSLPAGTTSWTDNGLTAERSWSYDVRAVGIAGASAFSPAATAATPASFSVAVVKGKRVDSAKPSRDSVNMTFVIQHLEGGSAADPVVDGLQVGIGGPETPAFLVIAPGSEGWTSRNGVWTWKSAKGSVSKVKLTYDPATGTVKVKATKLQLPALSAGDLRTWFRSGEDAGSVTSPWLAVKTGTLATE